jgi:hypothetical protein
VIEGRAALLRRGLPACVLSAPASERCNCGRHNGRQYGFSHLEKFRLRDARGNPCRARDACGFHGDTQSMPTAHGAGDAHRRR